MGHTQRVDDGRIPSDVPYGRLNAGKRATEGPCKNVTLVLQIDRHELFARTTHAGSEDKHKKCQRKSYSPLLLCSSMGAAILTVTLR